MNKKNALSLIGLGAVLVYGAVLLFLYVQGQEPIDRYRDYSECVSEKIENFESRNIQDARSQCEHLK